LFWAVALTFENSSRYTKTVLDITVKGERKVFVVIDNYVRKQILLDET
jgi:hypothetical protein